MAKSAAIPLAFAGVATIFIISGLEGESLAETIKGEFGKGTKHELPSPTGETTPEGQVAGEASEVGASGFVVPGHLYGKFISPFPKGELIHWGRSDQGVDGVAPPGTPMLALGNGMVTIAGPDPGGFGNRYPVLHIDNDGSYYYGHSVPLVTGRVHAGEVIAQTNTSGQGNATTPGSFEIGKWPPGSFATAGAEIRSWLLNLPRI